MDPAIAAVDEVNAWVSEYDADYYIALDRLLHLMVPGNVDAIYERMVPKLKVHFLNKARLQLMYYDEFMRRPDAKHWAALFELVYRQPFDIRPAQALDGLDRLPEFEALTLLLPHFTTRTIDEVVDVIHARWRAGELVSMARGLRPGIDVVLATCRAHGQDPTPFLKLMEWEAAQPNT